MSDLQIILQSMARCLPMLDTAVYHNGSFCTQLSYEQSKDARREYKAAMRRLKKLIKQELQP